MKSFTPFFAVLLTLVAVVLFSIYWNKARPVKIIEERVEIQSIQVGDCKVNIGNSKGLHFIVSPNCSVGVAR